MTNGDVDPARNDIMTARLAEVCERESNLKLDNTIHMLHLTCSYFPIFHSAFRLIIQQKL